MKNDYNPFLGFRAAQRCNDIPCKNFHFSAVESALKMQTKASATIEQAALQKPLQEGHKEGEQEIVPKQTGKSSWVNRAGIIS
jgi:hypothetical protein